MVSIYCIAGLQNTMQKQPKNFKHIKRYQLQKIKILNGILIGLYLSPFRAFSIGYWGK
jgi:hypothetical protein